MPLFKKYDKLSSTLEHPLKNQIFFGRKAGQLGAPNRKLVLDVSTRCNCTDLIPNAAFEFKHVFTHYASIDKNSNTTSSPTSNMLFEKKIELKKC